MWLRMRKTKKDKWEKMEVSVLDFFCWNLVMGLMLGISYSIIIYFIFLLM